jgi:DNA polymerase-3 subunit alpha
VTPALTVRQLVRSGRTEGEVKIAGLITGIDRRVSRQGDPWAIVTLTDPGASVEVLFFPKSYALVQHELIDDRVISVRGRLNERDGAISVFGQFASRGLP